MKPADSLIASVVEWANGRPDVLALTLVGSHARGDARPESDIDLVLVCSDPSRYLTDTSWVAAFGEATELSLEDWGLVRSVRVLYRGGPEVEFGFAGPGWMHIPPDRGTAAVIRDGCSILLDRIGQLTRLQQLVKGTILRIRRAQPSEADQLTDLVMAAKAHWGYQARQLDAWKPSLAVTPEKLAQSPAFVMEDHRVVGFYSFELRDGLCELDNFWIWPDAMGQGYGRQLLEHAKAVAKDLGIRELMIDSDPNAKSFYVQCGALVVGQVPAPIDGQPERCRPQLRIQVEP